MDLAVQPSPQMPLLQHPVWLSQGRSHPAADRTPFLALPEYRLDRLCQFHSGREEEQGDKEVEVCRTRSAQVPQCVNKTTRVP